MANAQKLTKSLDSRPCRKRYNLSCRLATRKIRNMIRCGGMKAADAIKKWSETRKRPPLHLPRLKDMEKYER